MCLSHNPKKTNLSIRIRSKVYHNMLLKIEKTYIRYVLFAYELMKWFGQKRMLN